MLLYDLNGLIMRTYYFNNLKNKNSNNHKNSLNDHRPSVNY